MQHKPSIHVVDKLNKHISETFNNLILLNGNNEIISISENIVNILGLEKDIYIGKNFNQFIGEKVGNEILNKLNSVGFLANFQVELTNKIACKCTFNLSAFSTKDHDYIIINLDFIDHIETVMELLFDKIPAIEDFVSWLAHNFRDSLATLIGLSKIFDNEAIENDYIIAQIDKHTSKLDFKLKEIVYFIERQSQVDFSFKSITFTQIADKLHVNNAKLRLEKNIIQGSTSIENGELILAILQKVKMLFYQHTSANCRMTFGTNVSQHYHHFSLSIDKIVLNKHQIEVLNSYVLDQADLSDPIIFEFYKIKKVILKLKGILYLKMANNETRFEIKIPITE